MGPGLRRDDDENRGIRSALRVIDAQGHPYRQNEPTSVIVLAGRRSVGPVGSPDQKHENWWQPFPLGLFLGSDEPIGAGHDGRALRT